MTQNEQPNTCRCGRKVELIAVAGRGGHGDYPPSMYISCECGLRTKKLYMGYEGNEAQIRAKLIRIWNGV